MHIARFIAFVVIVFALCAMPFLLVQASGISSAGFTAGFRAPLEQPWLLTIFLLIGVLSASAPKDGFMLIPLGCMMMVLCGTSLMMVLYKAQPMELFVLGGGLLFLVTLLLSASRINMLALLLSGSVGFHIGMHLVVSMPVIAAPLFYVLALLLAITLVLAIAVAFGITLLGERESLSFSEADMPQSPQPYWP
jgi:hypothetical protein